MPVRRSFNRPRRAAALVEGALVLSTAFLLTLGVVIAGLGVYRYQQVASLARIAARYASVHGGQYAQDTSNAKATPDSIYEQVIEPGAIGLDLNKLTYSISWDDSNEMPIYMVNPNTNQYQRNRVTVKVSYQWVPEGYFNGVTLTSTSVMEMSY